MFHAWLLLVHLGERASAFGAVPPGEEIFSFLFFTPVSNSLKRSMALCSESHPIPSLCGISTAANYVRHTYEYSWGKGGDVGETAFTRTPLAIRKRVHPRKRKVSPFTSLMTQIRPDFVLKQ